MTQKFTAEEVREKAYGYSLRGDYQTAAMLEAYADTLSKPADSGRVGDERRLVELCIFAVLGSRWEEGGSLHWTAIDAENFRSYMRSALRSSEWLAVDANLAERVLTHYVNTCIDSHSDDAPVSARIEAMKGALEAALAAQGQGDVVAGAPSIEAAEAMGAKGGPVVEAERLAFEAWMRGHCWALCATWSGTAYRSDAEQGGKLCPHAMETRRLWAAWRDRAALTAQPASPAGVPELCGWTLKLMPCRDGDMSIWALDPDGSSVYLAAAPSAPEGDGGGE